MRKDGRNHGEKLGLMRISCASQFTIAGVSTGSGLSLPVRVQVQTEPLPNWRSRLSMNGNIQFGYGSMVNSQPVWIGQVVSGSPSGSIYRFIYASYFWSFFIISYQNHISTTNNMYFLALQIAILINLELVLPLIYCIFAYQEGQWFGYERENLSRRKKVRRYLGNIEERYGRCRRNCVTERRRRWKTRKERWDGGGII